VDSTVVPFLAPPGHDLYLSCRAWLRARSAATTAGAETGPACQVASDWPGMSKVPAGAHMAAAGSVVFAEHFSPV